MSNTARFIKNIYEEENAVVHLWEFIPPINGHSFVFSSTVFHRNTYNMYVCKTYFFPTDGDITEFNLIDWLELSISRKDVISAKACLLSQGFTILDYPW